MAESSESSDESLDATSEKFDPLKALYSTKVKLPSSAKIYDNIAKFESILKGISISTKVCIAHCHVLVMYQSLLSDATRVKIKESIESYRNMLNYTN